jgi:hypothetical protein
MIKKDNNHILKLITLLIFVFSCQIKGHTQNLDEKIDISQEFKKIEEYNEYIRIANLYHYDKQKDNWKKVRDVVLGLIGVGSSIYLKDKGKDSWSAVVLGAGLGTIISPLLTGDFDNNIKKEQINLEKANSLFKNIPK